MYSEIIKSKWIWLPQKTISKHQYVCFRKSFPLRNPQENATLDISADSDFILFVNGLEAGRGQFSDYPSEKTFTRFEIGGKLKTGDNCVAVLAYYRGEDFSDHRAGKPGLIVALDSGAGKIFSDETWKCARHPAFTSGDMPKVTGQQGFTSCFDAREDLPWSVISFDDSAWAKAEVQAAAESGFWKKIQARPVPTLAMGTAIDVTLLCQGNFIREKEYPAFAETMANDALVALSENIVFAKARTPAESNSPHSFSAAENAGTAIKLNKPGNDFDGTYFIVDFGREEAGLLHFELEAPAGTVIDIGHGEHVHDGRIRTRLGGRNFADRYICREGRNGYTLPFRRIGGRYLQVHVSNYSEPLEINYFGLKPLSLPGLSTCEFRSSDSLADKIHEIGVRTLKCCMHEHYEDTPWREQSLYAFDGRNQALYGYCIFGNYEFAATSFVLLGRGIRADGLLELCAPAKVSVTIPSFSLVWVTALAEHWMHSGSSILFDEFAGQIKTMLEMVFARRERKSGLYLTPDFPDSWHFYEWVPGLDKAGSPGLTLDAPYNLYLHETLKAYCQMLRLSGNIQEADKIDAKRHDLGHAIAKTFWDGRKQCLSSFVLDGKHSGCHQLVQCLALNEKLLDLEQEKQLVGKLFDNGMQAMTLSSMLYLLRALMDRDEASRKTVSSVIHDNWGKMILAGASTCWETIRGEADFGGAGSLCHGWSALPVYYYHAYVLGIRPLEPGFKTFSVTPYCDRFHHAEGEVMTPHGKISVKWCKNGGEIELSLNHPPECKPIYSSYPECKIKG
jgi:alpha-L-rhamnosidase